MRKKNLYYLITFLSVFLIFANVIAADGNEEFMANVKILLYHNVTPYPNPSYSSAMSVQQFREEIYWLRDNGYKGITISDLYNILTEEKQTEEKLVAITFDDGYVDVYNYAFPILKEEGFIATTYLVGEKINMPKNLTSEMIVELHEAGWEIGSHTMSHPNLVETEDISYEICQSRSLIAQRIGHGFTADDIKNLAYPYGSVDERVANKTYKCGFDTGRSLGKGQLHSIWNRFYLSCETVLQGITLEEFEKMMKN